MGVKHKITGTILIYKKKWCFFLRITFYLILKIGLYNLGSLKYRIAKRIEKSFHYKICLVDVKVIKKLKK
tara:strand:+ start:1918 stop:2127 length:210 start_codon:yes stop_codon:yes gene_type:complete